MRRRLPLAGVLLAAAAVAAGCGSTSQTGHTFSAPAGCQGHAFKGAGDCTRQILHHQGFTLTPPARVSGRAQGVDVSRWQGLPSFSASGQVRFAIVQTNDGPAINPFFRLQVAELNAHHIPWGTYTFLEGYSGASQAYLSNSITGARGRTLGMWGDAEQPSAYPQTCSYVNEAAHLAHIVGVYGSPGTYRGGRCKGYDWPAEWGSGRAYPLPGYPSSATKVRQWCGTCRLAGFSGEVDRDEDLGLLVAAKPAITPHQRRQLDRLISRHHCRQPPWHAAKPTRYEHACHVWLHELG